MTFRIFYFIFRYCLFTGFNDALLVSVFTCGTKGNSNLALRIMFSFYVLGSIWFDNGMIVSIFKQNKSKFVVKLIRVSKTVLSYRQNYSPDVETSVTPLWTSSDEKVSHSLLTSHVFLTLFDTGHMPNGYLHCIFMCVFNFAFNFVID